MGDSPDFIQQFHNLEGDLISVRKKNFHKLLKTLSFQNEEQLNNILKELNPKTHQENLFYVDTLIYFKRTDKLLELLKSGNEIYSSKILKQLWFFEVAFKDIDPAKLVNEFLPYLSYSIRKKFLGKILRCWKTERIDLLFDALDEKYGLTVAIPVLHKCTPTKIKSILSDNEVTLRPNQVLELINISDHLFKIYLDHVSQISHSRYDEGKVLNYLAKTKPNLYVELQKLQKIAPQSLSKRNTKIILPIIKEDVLTNSEHYFRFLHKAVAIRKLGHDFEIIYKRVFPDHFKDISSYSTSNRWLEYYPKRRRWNLFLQTCSAKYPDKSLEQMLYQMSYQIKNMNPPKEILLKWAEVWYQKQEGNFEEFLKYYEPATSIPMIKEKINVTKDIYKRGNLIQLMIKSCSEHKDFAALEQVLQYICFRHRNEDANFRNNILTMIRSNFKLEELNENHWKCINEQIKILRIQKEFHFFVNADFLERHLEFLFKNKKDHKDALIEYITDSVIQRRTRLLSLNNKPIEKEIYIEIGNILSVALDKNSEEFLSHQIRILTTIINFSTTNTEYCININGFADFLELIKRCFSQTGKPNQQEKNVIYRVINYNLSFPQYAVPIEDSTILNIISLITSADKSFSSIVSIYHKFVLKNNRNELENSMLQLYFDKLYESFPDVKIFNWFLLNEPKILVPNFDTILRKTLKAFPPLNFKIIKNYSHLNFDEKVCKFYKIKLDDEEINDRNTLVTALSILLSTSDFQKLVEEKYLPKRDKLDMEDKEMLLLYKLQCDVVKRLSQVAEPYIMLPTIMKFCKGDYLQSALNPLYKAFYRSPERMLYSFVESLSKMAVSVRKHAIFLSCEVLDKEHTLNLLKNTNEGNVSSQKHIFSATLKYFLKNPSNDLLEKLIESMSSIDKNDTETLDSLKNVTVPLKFRPKYLENCWSYFESLGPKGVKIEPYLEQLLVKMKGDILPSLSTVFVTNIINNYFVRSDRLKYTDEFVVEVLKSRLSERSEYFTLVFDILSKSSVTTTSNFFVIFINGFDSRNVDKSLALLFSQHWKDYFTMIDYLNEHILLNLCMTRLSTPSIDVYAGFVVEYLHNLTRDFSFHVYNNFRRALKEITRNMFVTEFYSLLLNMLNCSMDASTCILVLDLLQSNTLSERNKKEHQTTYNKILAMIELSQIPIVKAYRINFLNNKL